MRHMTLAGRTHYNAMVCIMDYCMTTPERGLALKPHSDWEGISADSKFEVKVKKIPAMLNVQTQEGA